MKKITLLSLVGVAVVATTLIVACKKSSSGGGTKPLPTTPPYFANVKTIVGRSCAVAGCHNGTQAPDLRSDANIAAQHARIKIRAVDGTGGFMPAGGRPQLPANEKTILTNWDAAGGKTTD